MVAAVQAASLNETKLPTLISRKFTGSEEKFASVFL